VSRLDELARMQYEERAQSEAMHAWFGLSYANYLAVPRALIQGMSDEWQTSLARLLDELYEASRVVKQAPMYRVHATDEAGRFMRDPVPHYRRDRMAAHAVAVAMGQRDVPGRVAPGEKGDAGQS